MDWRDVFGLVFLAGTAAVFWALSKSLHSNYNNVTDRRIYIPHIFHKLFGKPGTDGTHNVSGIYGQAFTILMVIVFTLQTFDKITRNDATTILATGCIILIAIMELYSLFQKKENAAEPEAEDEEI